MSTLRIDQFVRSDDVHRVWLLKFQQGHFTCGRNLKEFSFAEFDICSVLQAAIEHFATIKNLIGLRPVNVELDAAARGRLIDMAVGQYLECKALVCLTAQTARVLYSSRVRHQSHIEDIFLGLEGAYHRMREWLSANGVDDTLLKAWLIAAYQLDCAFEQGHILMGNCDLALRDPFELTTRMSIAQEAQVDRWNHLLQFRSFQADDAQHAVVGNGMSEILALTVPSVSA